MSWQNDFFAVMPGAILAIYGCGMMLLRLDSSRPYLVFFLFAEAFAALGLWRQTGFTGLTGFRGSLVVDEFSIFLNAVCLIAAVLSAVGGYRYMERENSDEPEYYGLLLLAQSGMYLIINGTELVTIFIGLELTAVCFYVLTGYLRDKVLSTEAALKYLLLGAFSSGLLLYGMSILYGLTGTTRLGGIQSMLAPKTADELMVGMAITTLLAGLFFKIAAAPMHMWAPDAYEGAPTPVTAYLATASKAASFAFLLRLLLGPLRPYADLWQPIVIVAALLSLFAGNIAALTQTNAKRLLAYSSVGHVGYLLLGLEVRNTNGLEGVVLYLMVYMLMTAGAFLVLAAMDHEGVDDFRGLLYKKPALALLMTLLLVSLAGLPPTAGFFAKYKILLALVEAGQYWLAAVAGLFVAVSLYFYFRIVREMLREPEGEAREWPALTPGSQVALALSGLATLGLGLYPQPILDWARSALR